MEKLFAFFVIVILTKSLAAQTPQPMDTLAHLQSIVARKSDFIGKPFSVLNDSLNIRIQYFSPYARHSYDMRKETSTSFAFYWPQSEEDHYRSYPRLEIQWYPSLDAVRSRRLWDSLGKGAWSDSVRLRYSGEIVSDISILD